MLAVEHSDDKMTEMLVDAGASVEAKDAQGLTAFDYLVAPGEQKDESEGSWFKKPVQEVHHSECNPDRCTCTLCVSVVVFAFVKFVVNSFGFRACPVTASADEMAQYDVLLNNCQGYRHLVPIVYQVSCGSEPYL